MGRIISEDKFIRKHASIFYLQHINSILLAGLIADTPIVKEESCNNNYYSK